MPAWQAEAKSAGLIYPEGADTLAYVSGSTLNPNYALYSVADGLPLGEFTAKELEALDIDGGGRRMRGGLFLGMRRLERRDDGGVALWTYEGRPYLAACLMEDGLLVVAERPAGISPKLVLARLDPETGEVLWRKEEPLEVELSLASVRGPGPDYYHVQMGFVEGKLAVISKGLLLVDPSSGDALGSIRFSVQDGVDAAQGGRAMANSGTLGGAALGAAVAGAAKVGEVFPAFSVSRGNVIVHDIEGTVYAMRLDDGRLAWKAGFDRVSAIDVDRASGEIAVVTGMRMVNGLGKAVFDGKPGIAVLDAEAGRKLSELETGWVVGSAPAKDGGTWLFTADGAALVRAMAVTRRLDFMRDAGVKGVFAVVPIDGGARAAVFSESAITLFDPERGEFGIKIQLDGFFHSLNEFTVRGKYLAAEIWPGKVNFQKCAFVCVDLKAGRLLYQIPTGVWNDGRKTKLREFTLFADAGIFAMAERGSGQATIRGYRVFPEDAEDAVRQGGEIAAEAEPSVRQGGEAEPEAELVSDPSSSPESSENPPERDGFGPDTAFEIPYKAVKLEKKLDSWAGLEPLTENSFGAEPFLGSVDYAISKVYLCKDDKYLYWRIDFYGANPIAKRPKDLVNKIYAQILIAFAKGKYLSCGVNMFLPDIELIPFASIWDRAARTGTSISGAFISIASMDSSLVGRVDLKTVAKYCRGPISVMANIGTQHKGAASNVETKSENFWVEF